MPMIPNKYPKFCTTCGVKVGEREGFAVLMPTGKWDTFCKSSACLPTEEVARKQRRILDAAGRAFFPYDPAAVKIIKLLRGAYFSKFPEPHWQLPVALDQRAELLRVAAALHLDVASELTRGFTPPADPDAVDASVIEAAMERAVVAGAYPYQVEGVRFLTEHKRCLLGDDMGLGKASPLHSKVLTPTGWATMGDMKVGTEVLNPEGGVATVIRVYPQGVRPVYRLTFSDGTTCEADEGHVWKARTRYSSEWTVVTTAYMEGWTSCLHEGRDPLIIPWVNRLDFDAVPGSGVSHGEMPGLANMSTPELRKYLVAPHSVRVKLAERIVNGPGIVRRPAPRTGPWSFAWPRADGAADVRVDILRSCGWFVHQVGATERELIYDVQVPNIDLPTPKELISVEFVEHTETQCILLDSANHLYVTDDYIVTHNTMQSLLAIPEGFGALVIVPSTVKLNWLKECKQWRPDLKPFVLQGKQPEDLWPEEGEVLILNPDILPAAPAAHTDGYTPTPMMIIGDEGHMYKNRRTKRHKSMKAWGDASARFTLMTGTPMTNRPPDLWGVLSCLGLEKKVFDSYRDFCRLFGNISGGKDWNTPNVEVPMRLRRVMLRRRKDEVLKDLPPWTDQTYVVDVPPDVELIAELDLVYDEVKDELAARKLPEFHRMAKVRSMLASAKTAALLDLLDDYEENDTPVVVFSVHKPPVRAAGARPGWATITGETKNEDRQAIVERFQRGDLKGLALTVGAGSVGITLTRASHMIFVDLDWTPALNHQARDRINRIGQEAESLTYTTLVVDHPLDERVSELLRWKTELFKASIEASSDVMAAARAQVAAEAPAIEYDPSAVDLGIVTETAEERDARIAQEGKTLDTRFVHQQPWAERGAYAASLAEAHRRGLAKRNLPAWLARLRNRTAGFTQSCMKDRDAVQDALRTMLGNCDGAQKDDGIGFNKPDSAVARCLASLDIVGDDEACEAVARLLYKYRRQVSAVAPHLYEDL